jgi:mannose-6-phosphate isomerase-like protein (cupin superfamily)
MKHTTLKSPSADYDVTILKSSDETDGRYSFLKVNLYAGAGNELHYHTTFTEHFEVISGILSVQLGKEVKHLHPGQTFRVEKRLPHRFYNETKEPAVFHCTITPARNFEKALRIGYGLANAGLMNKKGIPKKFLHGVVLFHLSESYLHGLPLWFQSIVFGGLARIARWLRVEQSLEKYC